MNPIKLKQKLKIIKTKTPIIPIAELHEDNTFCAVDEEMEFYIIIFNNSDKITASPLIKSNPDFFHEKYYYDPCHNFIWSADSLDSIDYLDISKRTIGSINTSTFSLDYERRPLFICNYSKSLLLIEFHSLFSRPLRSSPDNYLLYDLKNNCEIFKSPGYYGELFPYEDNSLLFYKYEDSKWNIVNSFFKKQKGNFLVKKLSEAQIEPFPYGKGLYTKKNGFFFGYKRPLSKDQSIEIKFIYFDEKKNILEVRPLRNISYDSITQWCDCLISPDGEWLKVIERKKTTSEILDILVFYKLDRYNENVLIKYAEYELRKNSPRGIFMAHNSWGMCFIQGESTPSMYFTIYMMN